MKGPFFALTAQPEADLVGRGLLRVREREVRVPEVHVNERETGFDARPVEGQHPGGNESAGFARLQ